MKKIPAIWLPLLLALLLFGCAPAIKEEAPLPPAFDPSGFRGGDIYDIDPQRSQIRVLVYRGGALSRLGHNHVISTRDIHGKIYRHRQLLRYSGIVMQLPVDSFEVDNPALRSAAGPAFNTVPSEKDIAGTRGNMLGEHVLDSEHYPDIRLVSVDISGNGASLDARMRVTVRGVSTDIDVPFTVHYEDRQILINGQTEISQTALGMKPFSILMGAIAVQDEMTVQFDLVATKTASLPG
jgi:polyisoprenoid-binding protein YceI